GVFDQCKHRERSTVTGRRKRAKETVTQGPEPVRSRAGPEMFRRALLGFVTALIVARPLVLGEDPGIIIHRLTDASNLVLTLLWLAPAVGWAAWRMQAGRPHHKAA